MTCVTCINLYNLCITCTTCQFSTCVKTCVKTLQKLCIYLVFGRYIFSTKKYIIHSKSICRETTWFHPTKNPPVETVRSKSCWRGLPEPSTGPVVGRGGGGTIPRDNLILLMATRNPGINSPVEVGYPMICKGFCLHPKGGCFGFLAINSTIPIRSRLDSVHHNSSNKSRPKILWAGTCHFTCTLPLTGGKTVPTLKKTDPFHTQWKSLKHQVWLSHAIQFI